MEFSNTHLYWGAGITCALLGFKWSVLWFGLLLFLLAYAYDHHEKYNNWRFWH